MDSTKSERRHYALLQAAATIYAGLVSHPDCNAKDYKTDRAIEKGLKFAIDRAEGLLVRLERIDNTRPEDTALKDEILDHLAGCTTSDLLDLVEGGGKGSSRGNAHKK